MSVIIQPMSTWSGKTLGNVNIGDLIARGGMAEVYHGTHTRLKRNVAVKIMRDHVEEDPDSRARFDREARVVANLDHPNIIQIFDYDLVDGRPCLVMELVSGSTLASYMKAMQKRGEKLSHQAIARLLAPIASAMDYAHTRNIVHRDIKPANILLRPKNGTLDIDAPLPEDVEPVLTDFGLVRLLDSSTQTSTGTVSGTPSYMSPEQARGDRVDQRTDIYSLGVVLYEMLAGTVPFDAESSFGVLMKHLNEPPPPIEGISKDMQAIIKRALAKDPAQRYDSAGELVNEFVAVLNGKPVSAKTEKVGEILNPMKTAPVPAAPPSRTPWILGALGGAVVLAIVFLAGIRFMRQSAIRQPAQDPNLPVGRITYLDFNSAMDKALVATNGLPLPEPGSHFEVWLISQGGENRRNLGTVSFEGEGGQLSYVNPDGLNLIGQFDQVEVTLEPNDDPNPNQPSGVVVASSVYPPMTLIHVRHILVSIGVTPDGTALIQGLWSTVDTVDTSVLELRDAYKAGDEAVVRLKTEEIINQIVGDQNTELYKDWNADGQISDPSDGFGLLPNGETENSEGQGYFPLTMSHAQFAADAPDSFTKIQGDSERIITCVDNMQDLSNEILGLALELQAMPFDPSMEAAIAELEFLSSRMLYGEDANSNGRIEPILNECGADTAYEQAYHMADMPLFTGTGRMPQP